MDQLARLVTVFDQEGAQQLIKSLKDVQTNSKGAEVATEQLTDATKKAAPATKAYSTGLDDMNAHLLAYKKNLNDVKVANDNAAKTQRALGAASLNLGRQFSDVGVSLASGINPLMVLIQQGPQIADGFAVASQAGLGFKSVIAGITAQLAPLVATFAPWIAGLAAVSAGIYLLVRAEDEHIKRIEKVNKEITDLHKNLSDAAPWLFETANQSNLAADGTKNFNAWVEKANSKLPEYTANLRAAAIEQARLNVWNAKNQQQTLVNENFKVVGGVPTYNGKGSAWWQFGLLTGALDKGYKEYTSKAREAAENVKAANAQLEAMLAAPVGAFSPDSAKDPKKPKAMSQKDKNLAAAIADGRLSGKNPRNIALESIASVGQENYTGGHLNKYSLGGDRTIGGDPMVTSAEEAAKQVAEIDKRRAKDRLDTERDMWRGLTSLSSSGNRKLAAIGKAAAIAEATIDGIKAVQKAYASLPFPFNLAAAATMAGLTAINVAKIAGVQGFASGGYTGNGAVGAPAGVVHGQEFVVNAAATRQNRATLEAMNAGRAIPRNPAANSNSRGARLTVVPSKYFDVIVEEKAATIAAPIAQNAADASGQQAVQTTLDMYQRRQSRRLR